MKLFSAKKKEKADTCCVQTALSKGSSHPFSLIDDYSPYINKQFELYQSLTEAVPVIDAAISKLVRLLGTFEVECSDKSAQSKLNDFMRNVRVNSNSTGILQFISNYFTELLVFGTAVGEIVLSAYSGDIVALYNAPLKNIELRYADTSLDSLVYVTDGSGNFTVAPRQDLLCVTALNSQSGSLYGTSILKGLPFVSSILLKIFNTIGVNFERVGNVRFAVSYNPADSVQTNSKQKVRQIADAWSKAMRDKSQVSDFITVGDVSVKVIGADNQVLSCDIEIRHLLEQIVSKLCIPPFLLGLSWSSTERMSAVQADILTSEIDYYRNMLEPVIRKICEYYLRLQGKLCDFSVVWSNISLLDETELATARLTNAQAKKLEQELSEVKN